MFLIGGKQFEWLEGLTEKYNFIRMVLTRVEGDGSLVYFKSKVINQILIWTKFLWAAILPPLLCS